MKETQEVFLTFQDLKRLFKRLKPKLKRAALLSALIAFAFFALKEVRYTATATFKQSTGKIDHSGHLKDILRVAGFIDSDSNALALMLSEKMVRSVIEDLGMQMEVKTRSFPLRGFSRLWSNLVCELGGELKDREGFAFSSVQFDEEKPLHLFLQFKDRETFVLLNAKKQLVKEGRVREKIEIPGLSFTLSELPRELSLKKCYALQVSPWQPLAGALLKRLEIKPTRHDKSLLRLTFSHRDRQLAARFLNEMMAAYQSHLKLENEQLRDAQLVYLEKRQEELAEKLDRTLNEQAAYLKENLGDSGFIGLKQEVEMLAIPKQTYTSKLFDMELEQRRLEKKELDEEREDEEINRLAKTQQDREQKSPYSDEEDRLQNRLATLNIEESDKQAAALFARSHKGNADDLKGINLETAQTLYAEYNRELDEIQSHIRQLSFLRSHIHEPTFELSSLSSLLTDNVSQGMVAKAADVALQLNDEKNHSLRELERLKEALFTQKTFLMHHIDQTVELNKEKAKLVQGKVFSLQRLCIDLIQKEKGLIQEKLGDLSARMGGLPEKWRLENQLQFKKELSMGVMEGISQLVESKNLHFHLFHVDSKPIDRAIPPLAPKAPHLFLFSLLAACLGASFLYAFHLGRALLRGLPLTFSSLQANGLKSCGVLSRFSNAPMKELHDRDLETLREIASFALFHKQRKERAIVVALLGGKWPDYSPNLAELLSMQGKRVLLIQCAFDALFKMEEGPGLWHFLKQGETPKIQKKAHYDFLPTHGNERHAAELLSRSTFCQFLEERRAEYDLILLFSSAKVTLGEARAFLKLADAHVVTVSEERLEDLKPYSQLAEEKDNVLFAAYEI